ncbi:hypothetical protein [Candidatus Nitrosocosmicus franklandus]|nr:hypothetical protein [Candidatus Nitrosocosmicus franklandus]
MIALAITSINNIVYVSVQLTEQRGIEYIPPGMSGATYSGVYSVTDEIYIIVTSISFILTWIATVFLLRHYSKKMGRFVYWLVVFAPLVGFLFPFQNYVHGLLRIFYDSPTELSIVSSIIETLIIPAGAVLFGIAFLSIGRQLSNLILVKDYMFISGLGIMLFFIANNPTFLTLLTFPPFGLSTVCLVGISSYLLLVGIYTSSISVAGDAELLRAVRRSLPTESNLLEMIGSAQQMQDIENRTIKMTNELSAKMMFGSGAQTSLDDEDIKEYLAEIVDEIRREKESNIK